MECIRWAQRGQPGELPKCWRLCHFCYVYQQDAFHALVCAHLPVVPGHHRPIIFTLIQCPTVKYLERNGETRKLSTLCKRLTELTHVEQMSNGFSTAIQNTYPNLSSEPGAI